MYRDNTVARYMHPPSCLTSVRSQKPHKTRVLQTQPPWARHGQEIGRSFPPGSWPSRSCLSLLKSHKMKTFTDVIPGSAWGGSSGAFLGGLPASGMHPPPKLALGCGTDILMICVYRSLTEECDDNAPGEHSECSPGHPYPCKPDSPGNRCRGRLLNRPGT